jgi:hypothetical protein
MAPLRIPMMYDMRLRRVSPMMDHLLAVAMREVGRVCPFSCWFASSPFESAYAGVRPVHDAPRLACDGRLLVLPWPPPLKCSLQYAEKTACCLSTIAQCGTYYLADHRTLTLREESAGRREPSRAGRHGGGSCARGSHRCNPRSPVCGTYSERNSPVTAWCRPFRLALPD